MSAHIATNALFYSAVLCSDRKCAVEIPAIFMATRSLCSRPLLYFAGTVLPEYGRDAKNITCATDR